MKIDIAQLKKIHADLLVTQTSLKNHYNEKQDNGSLSELRDIKRRGGGGVISVAVLSADVLREQAELGGIYDTLKAQIYTLEMVINNLELQQQLEARA